MVARTDEQTLSKRYRAWSRDGRDERARRLWAAARARSAGRGGVAMVARATGISESTVRRGLRELQGDQPLEPGRIRRAGAGRAPITTREPGLEEDLDRLLEPSERERPRSPLRWTCKSGATLAAALRELDHQVADRTVLRLLRRMGYSLQANRDSRDGARHVDRNAQFEYINRTARGAVAASQPLIHVELERLAGTADRRLAGTADRRLAGTADWRQVGITGETAALTVEAIGAWWEELGRPRYPIADTLTITADCGGSGSERTRAWRSELQRLADSCALELLVCHFPAGTSRWNAVEHRLLTFGALASPASSHRIAVNLVAGAGVASPSRTPTYERQAPSFSLPELDLSDRRPAAVNFVPAAFQGDWNYRIIRSVIKS
jgi:hypothetical protein